MVLNTKEMTNITPNTEKTTTETSPTTATKGRSIQTEKAATATKSIGLVPTRRGSTNLVEMMTITTELENQEDKTAISHHLLTIPAIPNT